MGLNPDESALILETGSGSGFRTRHKEKKAGSGSAIEAMRIRNPGLSLKGPKREMFVAVIFTVIRPLWVGDLETRPKNL